MILTLEKLLKLAPDVQSGGAVVACLNAAMERFSIDTPMRAAYFLAQVIHESGEFSHYRENLNYSAVGLLRTWPNRFKNQVDAEFYARQPAKIANFVYAGRMGNGDEKSGDGWKYRGAGWLQLTGKNAQRECCQELGCTGDIGDWLSTVNGAALSAAWFWWKSGCNRYADQGNVDAVSDIINIGHRTDRVGDSIGYDKRLALTNLALKVLA